MPPPPCTFAHLMVALRNRNWPPKSATNPPSPPLSPSPPPPPSPSSQLPFFEFFLVLNLPELKFFWSRNATELSAMQYK